jgi:hypothetical protein
MILQLAISSAIIMATIVIHIGFTTAAEWGLSREHIWPGRRAGPIRLLFVLVSMSAWLLLSISVCVWLWILCLRWIGVFHDLETAVYFSLVSFTTIGFGDVVLEKEWRILSAMMGANGLLIFGLTTAVMVDFLARFKRS